MIARPASLLAIGVIATVAAIGLSSRPMADRADRIIAEDGIVRVKSAYSMGETVERLQKDVAAKGIKMFSLIDQAGLAADAGIALRPSVLLVFGNPALGVQFITSKSQAGLDWPVRLLVQEDETGMVWTTYTDFAWIERRHRITDRKEAFEMASRVIESITSSVTAK